MNFLSARYFSFDNEFLKRLDAIRVFILNGNEIVKVDDVVEVDKSINKYMEAMKSAKIR